MRSRDFSEFTVGTLASLTAQTSATKIDNARLQGCSLRKNRYKADWQGKTAGVNEGPLAFGVMLDMTGAEIALAYAADPQNSGSGEIVELASSHMPLIELGRIGQSSTNSGGTGTGPMDAALRSFKFPWDILEGEDWKHYLFNANPASPLTTGMTFQMYTECLGEWRND